MTENALSPVRNSALPSEMLGDVQHAILQSKSPATLRAYRGKWAAFERWCAEHGTAVFPADPETIASYLVVLGAKGVRVPTIRQALAAIAWRHEMGGVSPLPTKAPMVKAAMAGITRSIGGKIEKKRPMIADITKVAASHVDDGPKGIRDRALLLLGFGGAFRRSELSALNIQDLNFSDAGLDVHIARSKTDQAGEGVTVSVVRGGMACPVEAVQAWVDLLGAEEGPLFRQVGRWGDVRGRMSGEAVALVVKDHAARAGFDPRDFGAHSLRAGFITSAAERGAPVSRIRDVSRHKSVDVLMGYVRHAERFKGHAGEGLL